MIGSIYGLIVTYPPFRVCVLEQGMSTQYEGIDCEIFGRSAYTWVVGLISAGFTTVLFCFQMHMILTGETTLEFFTRTLTNGPVIPKEQYDRGIRANFSEHFGGCSGWDVAWFMFLPLLPVSPSGDGVTVDVQSSQAGSVSTALVK